MHAILGVSGWEQGTAFFAAVKAAGYKGHVTKILHVRTLGYGKGVREMFPDLVLTETGMWGNLVPNAQTKFYGLHSPLYSCLRMSDHPVPADS